LDYSKDIRLELSETSPKRILKEALRLLKAPVNVELIDKTDEKTALKVDPDKMLRVFVNVMKNSFEAMPKGGKLVAESHEQYKRVVISFSDTGIGISKKLIDKIWTPLTTTKAQGMGFGLPICKKIVEAHGGSISINSIQGKGTTVTMTLPVNPMIKTDEEISVNLPESIIEKQKPNLS
jgi:signal transduction histidine kinase